MNEVGKAMSGIKGGDPPVQDRQQYRLDHAVTETNLQRVSKEKRGEDGLEQNKGEQGKDQPSPLVDGNVLGRPGNAVPLAESTKLIIGFPERLQQLVELILVLEELGSDFGQRRRARRLDLDPEIRPGHSAADEGLVVINSGEVHLVGLASQSLDVVQDV